MALLVVLWKLVCCCCRRHLLPIVCWSTFANVLKRQKLRCLLWDFNWRPKKNAQGVFPQDCEWLPLAGENAIRRYSNCKSWRCCGLVVCLFVVNSWWNCFWTNKNEDGLEKCVQVCVGWIYYIKLKILQDLNSFEGRYQKQWRDITRFQTRIMVGRKYYQHLLLFGQFFICIRYDRPRK